MECRGDQRPLIREYRLEDIEVLHEMDGLCFPPDVAFSLAEMLLYIKHKDSITRIAELENEIVGFAVGRFESPNSSHVITLDVIHAARRRKIGTALMDVLHDEFCRRGAVASLLEVEVGNAAARRFYEGLNYRYLEVLPGYYNGNGDALRMIRNLVSGQERSE